MPRSDTYTFDSLDRLWRHVVSSERPEDGVWVAANAPSCRKDRAQLVTGSDDLGIVFRLLALWLFVGLKKVTFLEQARSAAANRNPALTYKSFDGLRRHLELGNVERARVDLAFEEGFLDLVNAKRIERSLNKLPDSDVLFSYTYLGSGAFRDYREMLEHEFPRGQPLIAPDVTPSGADPCLDRVVEDVVALLSRDKSPASRPRLINVHGRHVWTGLSKVAAAVSARLQTNGRRSLVIPLRRQRAMPVIPEAGDGDGTRMDVSSSDGGEPRWGDLLNYSEVVGFVRAFVDSNARSVAQAAPFKDRDNLLDTIHGIRLKMAADPKVLIFDGYDQSEGSSSHLDRHVADSHVNNLISQLLDPPICSGGEGFDLAHFAENQIVITSNNPLPALDSITPVVEHGRAIQALPLWPPEVSLDDLFGRWRLQNTEDVVELYRTNDKLRNRRIDVSWLIDARIGLAKATTRPLKLNSSWPPPSTSDARFFDCLADDLLEDLSRKPVWRDLVSLLSFTPDGLRLATIQRFALAATKLPGDLQPFKNLVGSFQDGSLNREVRGLLNAMATIIGVVRNDSFEGVDDLPHPFELDGGQDRMTTAHRNEALDILYPDFKAAAKAHAALRMERLEFHAVHRLLAEEALQQQTVSLRHVDGTTLPSIRPWRRMLSAFYHGLQSLPIHIDEVNRTPKIEEQDFGGRNLITVGLASEMWLYLYAFGYRRMIERPPAWNLSRLYGLDALKVEILEAFSKPWILWPEQFTSTHYGYIGTEVQSLFLSHERSRRLAPDLTLSLAQAKIAIGDLSGAEDVLAADGTHAGASISRADQEARSVDLRQIKRMIDIRLLKCQTLADLDVGAVLNKLVGQDLDHVLQHIENVAEHFHSLVKGGVTTAVEADVPRSSELLHKLFLRRKESVYEKLSDIADLFFRLAEYSAVRADLSEARSRHGDVLKRYWDKAPILTENPLTVSSEIDLEFCRSLSQYRFAEQFRLMIFSNDLLGSDFFASGHPVRQSIRVALKLECKTHQANGMTRGDDVFGLFARFARRNSDTLTRHLFRYPRERASQLILEASMLRLLAGSNNRLEHLKNARSFIAEAEHLVLGLGPESRIHLRLALERNKINREIGKITELSYGKRRGFLDLSDFDILTLRRRAEKWDLPLWKVLAAIQKIRLDEARSQQS